MGFALPTEKGRKEFRDQGRGWASEACWENRGVACQHIVCCCRECAGVWLCSTCCDPLATFWAQGGKGLEAHRDIRDALAAGCANRCRETSLAGLGLGTHTKAITTIEDEVKQVVCCAAATHNDTVVCNPSALTERNCNTYLAKDSTMEASHRRNVGQGTREANLVYQPLAVRHVC